MKMYIQTLIKVWKWNDKIYEKWQNNEKYPYLQGMREAVGRGEGGVTRCPDTLRLHIATDIKFN